MEEPSQVCSEVPATSPCFFPSKTPGKAVKMTHNSTGLLEKTHLNSLSPSRCRWVIQLHGLELEHINKKLGPTKG